MSAERDLLRTFGQLILRGSVWLIVCALVIFVWTRPVTPQWVSAPIPGGTVPIGFTSKGELVTVDRQEGAIEQWKISTWNIQTGQMVHQTPTFARLESGLCLSWAEGTDSIITRQRDLKSPKPRDPFDGNWQIDAVSRRDGEFRFPPVPIGRCSELLTSPDGRYLLVIRDWSKKHSQNCNSLIDLQTGQEVLSPVVQDHHASGRTRQDGYLENSLMIFTEDSRELISLEYDTALHWWVVFRAIPSGEEVARRPLPAFPKFSSLRLGLCENGRIWFSLGQNSQDPSAPSIYMSFHLDHHELQDQRQEPGIAGVFNSGQETWRYAKIGNGWKAYVDMSDQDESRVKQMWNRAVSYLPLSLEVDDYQEPFGAVQFVSPANDSRIGRSIEITGHDGTNFAFKISPDGQWLVDGGPQLRAFKTPPPGRSTHWLGVMLITLAGWRIDRKLRGAQEHSNQEAPRETIG